MYPAAHRSHRSYLLRDIHSQDLVGHGEDSALGDELLNRQLRQETVIRLSTGHTLFRCYTVTLRSEEEGNKKIKSPERAKPVIVFETGATTKGMGYPLTWPWL